MIDFIEPIENNDLNFFQNLTEKEKEEISFFELSIAITLNAYKFVDYIINNTNVDPTDNFFEAINNSISYNHVESLEVLLKDQRIQNEPNILFTSFQKSVMMKSPCALLLYEAIKNDKYYSTYIKKEEILFVKTFKTKENLKSF